MERLGQIEKEQRKIVLDSYDIENQEESIRTERSASSNIRKIRKWKADITDIFIEMEEAGFTFEQTDTISKNQETETLPVEPPAVDPPKKDTSPLDKTNSLQLNALPKKELFSEENQSSLPITGNNSVKNIQYSVFGYSFSVNYWNELLVNFCEVMIKYKPEIVSTFNENSELNSRNRVNFSYSEDAIIYNGKQLSNNMWVETNRSAQNIKAVCYKILDLCGYDESQLVINVDGETLEPVDGRTSSPTVATSITGNLKETEPSEKNLCNDKLEEMTEKSLTSSPEQQSTHTSPEKSSKTQKFQLFKKMYFEIYWSEILVRFCEVMLKYKPEIISEFDKNTELNSKTKINFSYNKDEIAYKKAQLSNKIWLETNHSPEKIRELCYKILIICGFPEAVLVFYDYEDSNEAQELTDEVKAPISEKLDVTPLYPVAPLPETPLNTAFTLENSITEKTGVTPLDGVPVTANSEVSTPLVDVPSVTVSPAETLSTKIPEAEKYSPLSQVNSMGIISEMWLLGNNYKFHTSTEFLIKVCEMMVLHRPYVVGTFHENKSLNEENQVNFSYQESDMNNNGTRLNNGLWVNKNQQESKIISLCQNVVNTCGFGESDLKFTLKGGG